MKRLIHLSSAAVYGGGVHLGEDAPLEPLPRFAARAGLGVAWRFFGWGGEPAWIEGLTKTLLINCRRAAIELGWRSTRNAASVLAQT